MKKILTIAIILIIVSCSKDNTIQPLIKRVDRVTFTVFSESDGKIYLNDSLYYEGNNGQVTIRMTKGDSVLYTIHGVNARMHIERNDSLFFSSYWPAGSVSSTFYNN